MHAIAVKTDMVTGRALTESFTSNHRSTLRLNSVLDLGGREPGRSKQWKESPTPSKNLRGKTENECQETAKMAGALGVEEGVSWLRQ